jgi:glycosyltransferase involved in cell wall biosynthesis
LNIASYGWVLAGAPSLAGAHSIVLRELVERGHSVDFYAHPNHVPYPEGMEHSGFTYVPVRPPRSLMVLPRRPRRVAAFLMAPAVRNARKRLFEIEATRRNAEQPYDVLVTFGTPPAFAIPGTPTFAWLQGAPHAEAEALRELKRMINRASGPVLYPVLRLYYWLDMLMDGGALDTCDAIGCGSEWAAQSLSGNPLPSSAIYPIPYPVDLELFSPALDSNERSQRDPLVIFIGRLDPRKRIDLVLDGFELMRRQIPSARLMIVGSTRYANGQRRWVYHATESGAVRYIEHLPRQSIPDVMRAATVLVQPSMNENFGSAVAESLACGTPVVVGPTNGTQDYISRDSVVAPEYTPEAICDALIEVIARIRDEPQGVRDRARHTAEMHFSSSNVTAQLERAIKRSLFLKENKLT